MDITKLVRAKRRCGIFAWSGYIIASFLAVFALGMPWLYSMVVALFIVSYLTTRANLTGATIHSALIGLLLLLLALEEPKEPNFLSLNRWIALFLLIGLIWSLLGVKAAFTYHKLLPQGRRDEKTPSSAKWISRKLAILSSSRKRTIVLSYMWAIACLLPLLAPFIIWAYTGIDNMVKWFEGSDVLFWFVVGGYAFSAGPCLTGVYFFYTRAKRAATFDHDGTPRFVTCKWRDDEECYRLAIQCGLAGRYKVQQLCNE